MEKKILDGNKLIAEFMELPKRKASYGLVYNHAPSDNVYEAHELQYHTSWDWLMPVVEKICEFDNQVGSDYKRNLSYINLQIFKTSILCHKEAVYNRVIEFINWFNTQNIQP